MKKFLVLGLSAALAAGSISAVSAQTQDIKPAGIEIVSYDSRTNYMQLMQSCANEGSENALALGAIYEEQRNLKLKKQADEYEETSFFNSFDAEKIRMEIDAYMGNGKEDKCYTQQDAVMLTKLLYRECRGIPSDTEKACVVWTVLNRADHTKKTISEVITSPGQFSYSESAPVWDELYALTEDVLSRWNDEKNGETDVGRVLPHEYRWFYGDGKHNYFRNAYDGNYKIWDYSLSSPYEN